MYQYYLTRFMYEIIVPIIAVVVFKTKVRGSIHLEFRTAVFFISFYCIKKQSNVDGRMKSAKVLNIILVYN